MLIDFDSESVLDDVVGYLQDRCGEELPEGDERRMFAESLTAYLVALKADVDDVAKQKMLKYARGEVLDCIGEMYGCERIAAERATCTLRFSVDEEATEDIAIPANTSCCTAGGYAFSTTERAVIKAGELNATAAAVAEEAGSEYNGFVAGSVKIIQSAVAGVAAVENTDATHGGSDGEADDDEGNDSYRARIMAAQNAVNTAGTASSYSYFAKSADSSIADVSVPEPDEAYTVNIYIVAKGGEQLSDGRLAAVKAVCAADDVRPLGDKVEVLNAGRVGYAVSVSYTCAADAEDEVQAAVEGAGGAIDKYVEWQDETIGRDINPQKLMALCFAAGADTVTVTSPAAGPVSNKQVAKCTSRTASHTVVV